MLVQKVVAVVAVAAAPSVVKHVAVTDVWVVIEPAKPLVEKKEFQISNSIIYSVKGPHKFGLL